MKKIVLSLSAAVLAFLSNAQERNFWTAVDESTVAKNIFAARTKPQAYKIFKLGGASFRSAIRTVPSERQEKASASSFILTMPNAEGVLERFRVVEAPVMHPDLAARYPQIKSYSGKGIDEPSSSIRFDVTPAGFHGKKYFCRAHQTSGL